MSVFDIVTERVIRSLESGVVPWTRSWATVGGNTAYNYFSKHEYSLLNNLLLPLPGAYASFLQWQKAGYKIKSGEQPSIIVFWKYGDDNEPDGAEKSVEEIEKQRRPVLLYHRVFHSSQLVSSPEELTKEINLFDTDPIPEAQKLFEDYVVREGIHVSSELSDQAYYSPSTDSIVLPSPKQFKSPVMQASVSFHEAIHSTGSVKRLNRPGLQKVSFGSERYSKEELIAELGSAAILNQLSIETEASITNSNAYIQGWLQALRNDRKMIVYAASQAEKAVSFLKTGTVQQ